MYVTPDKLAESGKASVEAAVALVQTQFAALERFAALNLNTAKAAFSDSAAHVKSLLEAKDPQEVAKLSSAYAQPALEKAAAYGRSVYDLASEAQTHVTKIAESQAAQFNKSVASTLDSFAKNAPAGSDVAVNAMKTAFAAVNSAYDSMTKAAKQAAEVVEGNFATATKAKRS
jgi:phasin family protein